MPTLTLRPTNGTGSSWSNISNIYDGNTTTLGSVSIRSNNYSSRTLTLTFDIGAIPAGATINSAILNISSKASANNRITMRVDINGNSSTRVINQSQSNAQNLYTVDITNNINSLSNLLITGYITSSTNTTFSVYEVWIDIDYTEKNNSSSGLNNIKLGHSAIQNIYLGATKIVKGYLGDSLVFNNVNEDISPGENIIISNYSPNGQSFQYTVPINLSNEDYIEAQVNLSTCKGDWENVLAVGDVINTMLNDNAYHIYYSMSVPSLCIYAMCNGYIYSFTEVVIDSSTVTIKIDKRGISINGTYVTGWYETSNWTESTVGYEALKNYLLSLSNVKIGMGTLDDDIGSNAIYNYIKVVNN